MIDAPDVSKSPISSRGAEDLAAWQKRLGPAPGPADLGHALVVSAIASRPDTVEWLLAHGAPCDYADPRGGITPLMAALYALPEGPSPMPMADDAELQALDALGGTVVPWPDQTGREEPAQRVFHDVLSCSQHLDARSSEGTSAMLVAARNWRIDAVLRLAEAGADINDRDAAGESAIWYAAPSQFRALVDAHADIQASNRQGQTILHRAMQTLRGAQLRSYVQAALAAGAHDSRDQRGKWASESESLAGLMLVSHDDGGDADVRATIAATR